MPIQSQLLWHAYHVINWDVCLEQKVSEREEGVMGLHLSIGPFKTRSGFEPVPRCKPSTYRSISR